MPLKYRIPIIDIRGAGTTKQVINLPMGPRFHKVLVQEYYAGGVNTIVGAATNITKFRVLLNGRVQQEFSGTQLRDHVLLHGAKYDAAAGEVPNTAPGVTFPFYFAEPWRKDVVTQDSLAWPTGGAQNVGSFQIEVTATNACTLTVWAIADDVAFDRPHPITRILPVLINAGGTKSEHTFDEQSGRLMQLSIYPSSGGSEPADYVTLKRGNVLLSDKLSYQANLADLIQSDMVPVQAGLRTASMFDLVLDSDDIPDSGLVLSEKRDTQIIIDTSGAASETFTAMMHRIGLPE